MTGAFVPARSKLEAVSRISALTRSGPQDSRAWEQGAKSVLVDLASGFHIRSMPAVRSLRSLRKSPPLSTLTGVGAVGRRARQSP